MGLIILAFVLFQSKLVRYSLGSLTLIPLYPGAVRGKFLFQVQSFLALAKVPNQERPLTVRRVSTEGEGACSVGLKPLSFPPVDSGEDGFSRGNVLGTFGGNFLRKKL